MRSRLARLLAQRAGVVGALAAACLLWAPSAEAFAPPQESISTAAADVARATASDPTLATLDADLATPLLRDEARYVVAAEDALAQSYAGATANAATGILSNPTWLAEEPALAGSISSGISGASATAEGLAGGELLAGVETTGLVGSVAAAAPVVAVGATALGILAVGSLVISELSDPAGGALPSPANGGMAVDAERWEVAHAHPDSVPSVYPATASRAPWSIGDLPVIPAESWVLEVRAGGQWYWAPEALNNQSAPGSYVAWDGTCSGTPHIDGWPVTAGGAALYAGTPLSACQSSGAVPGQYSKVRSVVAARPGMRMPRSLPHAGSTAGLPSLPGHPPADRSSLAALIQALPGWLADGLHANAVQLLDSAAGAQVGGAVVPAPGSVLLPAPMPTELATDYVARLRTQGFTNVSLATSTTVNPDVGPSGVAAVSPAVRTAVALDAAISVKANPADAPVPGISPTQSIGSPGCSLTPPSSSLDLHPITGLQFGQAFPFNVLPWMTAALSGVATAGRRPQASFSVFGVAVSTGDSLAPLDPLFGSLRTFLAALLWIGVTWSLWRRTFGGAREV